MALTTSGWSGPSPTTPQTTLLSEVPVMLGVVTLFHGSKHPYIPGDPLVSGGIVRGCCRNEEGEPVLGCDCGCDGRRMVWATPSAEDALFAAENRPCGCEDLSVDHRPRVFEVTLDDPERDPNGWGEEPVMAASGRVVREVPIASLRPA